MQMIISSISKVVMIWPFFAEINPLIYIILFYSFGGIIVIISIIAIVVIIQSNKTSKLN